MEEIIALLKGLAVKLDATQQQQLDLRSEVAELKAELKRELRGGALSITTAAALGKLPPGSPSGCQGSD
jgi:hypothetical protein